jgi:2-keto-3-deoxy-L-rhamnonate aldolase RhmA
VSRLARLGESDVAFGVTLTVADPFLAEVIGAEPFDFVMVDTEHAPMSLHQLQTQLIALRASRATVLVRVADQDLTTIGQVLDLGADGIVVPQIENADDCRRVVSAALYPPRGRRGYGPRRAARLTDRLTYLASANDRVAVVIMIESAAALAHIDEILAVDGVTAVIIGGLDLAASLGHLDDPSHSDVGRAVDLIRDRCRMADVPYGQYAPTRAGAAEQIAGGARIVTLGSDLLFLEQGIRTAVEDIAALRDETRASIAAIAAAGTPAGART